MIEVTGLEKTFRSRKKTVKALKGVTFSAMPGEIYGLIGPNGAGKTTTLRTIATLLKPDAGTVRVNGADTVEKAREVRDTIGFLTSDMKLSGNLSPRELLRFFGELSHLDRRTIDDRIVSISGYLRMADFLDKPVAKLSTGMKQKAAIAVSIIHDPAVIVFDEPTAGLDILASKIVNDFLKDCRTEGKPVLLSTHNMDEAEKLCDRIGILAEGNLLVNGRLEEMFDRYGRSSLEELFFSIAESEGALADV